MPFTTFGLAGWVAGMAGISGLLGEEFLDVMNYECYTFFILEVFEQNVT
jgi:hypothetical protein